MYRWNQRIDQLTSQALHLQKENRDWQEKNIYDMTKEIAVLTVNKDYLTAKVLAKFKDDYKYL